MMKISVIIPVLNEQDSIGRVIRTLKERATGNRIGEILVVDGGSDDLTTEIAVSTGAKVIHAPSKGRAVQMNRGAECAGFSILYFLHADTVPPCGFDRQVIKAQKEGYPAGCFRLAFDSRHPVLRFYAWCTRFDLNAFRFGDQSLFVTGTLFETLGGFRSDYTVMEDNDMVRRIKDIAPFKIVKDKVITSARKYRANGVFRLQFIFFSIYVLFFMGFSQQKLVHIYTKWISD